MTHVTSSALLGCLIGAMSFLATPAGAASLTNYDQVERSFTVVNGDKLESRKIKPEETLENICDKGCTIKMQDGEEFELEGQEIAAIEEGKMFIDGYLNEQGDGGPAVDESAPAEDGAAAVDKPDAGDTTAAK